MQHPHPELQGFSFSLIIPYSAAIFLTFSGKGACPPYQKKKSFLPLFSQLGMHPVQVFPDHLEA